MNANDSSPNATSPARDSLTSFRPLVLPLAAGIFAWLTISVGFLGLKVLMRERPEFVGPPLRATRTELVQESPRVVARSLSDDISVIKATQPARAEVRFDMTGGRDYRGLRTIRDMSGECRAQYLLTNI